MKLPPRLWVPETARTGYDVPIPTATVNWPGRDWLIRRLSPGSGTPDGAFRDRAVQVG